MVVIHSERVSVPVPSMAPGAVFFDHGGNLMLVTDETDPMDDAVTCVNIETGAQVVFDREELAQPLKITMVEVK